MRFDFKSPPAAATLVAAMVALTAAGVQADNGKGPPAGKGPDAGKGSTPERVTPLVPTIPTTARAPTSG